MNEQPFDPAPVLEPRDAYGLPIVPGKTFVLRFLVTHEDGTKEEKRVPLTEENHDLDLADVLGLRDDKKHCVQLIGRKPTSPSSSPS